MKKIISFILCLSFVLLCACQAKPVQDETPTTTAPVTIDLTASEADAAALDSTGPDGILQRGRI